MCWSSLHWPEVRLARQNWSGAQEIGEAIKRIDNAQGVGDQVLRQH